MRTGTNFARTLKVRAVNSEWPPGRYKEKGYQPVRHDVRLKEGGRSILYSCVEHDASDYVSVALSIGPADLSIRSKRKPSGAEQAHA